MKWSDWRRGWIDRRKKMSYSGSGAGAGAVTAVAVHQAIANATKASGAIVKMSPDEFMKIINKSEEPLVVFAKGGFLNRKFRYLTSYRGLFFFTSASEPLALPSKAEVIAADKIWIPG
jgi:putative sterol carrier protein